jgi:hypothetical protein
MVPQFSMKFSKTEVLNWAKRYSYADDTEVEEIGVRSKLTGFYTREDFFAVCAGKTRGRPRRHYRRNSEGCAPSDCDRLNQREREDTGNVVDRAPWCLVANRVGNFASRTQRTVSHS